MITKIVHPSNNRMVGVRAGLHNGRFYLRVEFWSVSYRFTFKE